MRPIYETEAHLSEEKRIMDAAAAKWGCDVRKTERLSRVDYEAILDGDRVAWVEIKRRHNDRLKYPTLMLSAAKFSAGMNAGIFANIPFIILVGWNDGVFFFRATTGAYDLGVGGRSDRGDAMDQELVIHLPVDRFKPI